MAVGNIFSINEAVVSSKFFAYLPLEDKYIHFSKDRFVLILTISLKTHPLKAK